MPAKRSKSVSGAFGSSLAIFAMIVVFSNLCVCYSADRFSAVLKSDAGGNLIATFDLGEFENKGNFDVLLTIVNLSDASFPIDEVVAGCSCLKVKSCGSVLPAGGNLEIEVSLSASEKRLKSVEQLTWLALHVSKTKEISVRAKYKLKGVFGFRTSSYIASISDGIVLHRIPLLVSDRLLLSRLKVVQRGELKFPSLGVIDDEGEYFVELKVDSSVIPEGGASSTLTLADPETGMEDSILVVVEHKPQVAVFPSILRFNHLRDRQEKVGETEKVPKLTSQSYEATALVRIEPQFLSIPGIDDTESFVEISADSKFGKIKVETKPLGKGVFRLKMIIDTGSSFRSEGVGAIEEIKLQVEATTHSFEVPCRVLIR